MEPEEIVRLAVMAAGTADKHWQDRVVALVPRVAAQFRHEDDEENPRSLINVARKVTEAHVFKAEYRSHEYDENTQRIFVKLFDEKADRDSEFLDEDGCQTMRTEPMWSASGREMRRILEGLDPGQYVTVYRYSEQVGKTKKTSVLVHLEPLRQRAQHAPAPQRAASPPAEARPPAPAGEEGVGGSRAPAPSTDHAEAQAKLANRFDQLTGKQRIVFGRSCAKKGISNFMEPSEADISAVMESMKEAEDSPT